MPYAKAFKFTALLLVISSYLQAQPLSIYTNRQRDMIVWDNGMVRKVDYLEPLKLKVGRIAIPYIDNSNNFKIYYKGASGKMNIGFTNDFEVTDNLIVYRNASVLNVFDKGVTTELTARIRDYQLGDSLVVFRDGIQNEYKAYYEGRIIPIESFLASDALESFKVSDNIAAYVNYAQQFYILFHGETIPVEEFLVESFGAGRNIVPYVDINRRFKVFYNGKVQQLENFPPISYQTGDNLVAYISNDGYFKIFYDDQLFTVGFFTPQYTVKDHLVSYIDAGGYYRVFYKGELTTLEPALPKDIQMQYNSLVYRNNFNVLRMFSFGELYDVTSSDLDSFSLDYDVLQYRISNNLFRFFYQGKDY